MLVAVVGAGAVGSFAGARALAGAASEDVTVVLVGRPALVEAVESAGGLLTSSTLNGDVTKHAVGDGARLRVTTELAAVRDADVIIVAVKSTATEATATEIAAVLEGAGAGGRKTVVSLQNGVRNVDILRQALGEAHDVVAGIMEFNVVWEDKARFAQATQGKVIMASNGAHVATLARLLKQGGIPVLVEDDITAYQYGKLVINLSNSVNALSGVPLLLTFRDGLLRATLAASMREAIDVFAKAGIPLKGTKVAPEALPRLFSLPNCIFRMLQPILVKIKADAKLSMLQDMEKHKPTEVDFLNGEVVRIAATHNLPVPKVNAAILRLVQQADAAGTGSPSLDGLTLARECGLRR